MVMNIHITRNGEQHGPYPEESARQMLEAGQLLPADLAWHEGADGWKPLSEVLGAAAQPPATPPSPPAGGIPKRTMAGAAPAEGKPEDSEGGNPDQIRVTRKGEPIGPYSREKAKEYFASGQLLPTDWGWHDGMDDWKPINEVLGVSVPSQATAAAGKSGKGKKVAMIAGIVVLVAGLIFAGITYGPDLVAKISGASLGKSIIGTWDGVEKSLPTLEFLADGTVKIGLDILGKKLDVEGSYEFISKDRMIVKMKNPMGKPEAKEMLVSIDGDTLTLTKIDPDTGKEDPTDIDKFKRAK